jgi:hypothetical protein
MKKTAQILPLVMLASLTVATSCTMPSKDNNTLPVDTGSVVETGALPPIEANTGTVDPAQSGSASAPQTFTRTETLTYDSKSPEGMVPVEFSVTVTDGVITAASATPKAEKDASKYNQTNFAKEVSAKVVGKKAKDLDVAAIGGASLTTAAFEQFVHSF